MSCPSWHAGTRECSLRDWNRIRTGLSTSNACRSIQDFLFVIGKVRSSVGRSRMSRTGGQNTRPEDGAPVFLGYTNTGLDKNSYKLSTTPYTQKTLVRSR